MIDRFTELLSELGRTLHLTLHEDKHHACSIQVLEDLIIQIQLDVASENLFLFTKLIEVPPGRFRENVLREALKFNGLPDPRVGIFGYLAASNHLVLFQKYPLQILNGERLAGLFGAFMEFADLWRKAIAAGQSAPPSSALKLS